MDAQPLQPQAQPTQANPNVPFAGVRAGSALQSNTSNFNTSVIEPVDPQTVQTMLSQSSHPRNTPNTGQLTSSQPGSPYYHPPKIEPVHIPNQAELVPMNYTPATTEDKTAPMFTEHLNQMTPPLTTPDPVQAQAVTPQPAQPAQPVAVTPQPQQPVQAPIPIVTAPQPPLATEDAPEAVERFHQTKLFSTIKRIVHTIVTGALTIQGLYGLYKAINFVFFQLPIFEKALSEQQLGEATVNQFAVNAGLLIFSTAVSMFFAVQMAIFHRKSIKIIHIIVGILITILSAYVMREASNLNALELLDPIIP